MADYIRSSLKGMFLHGVPVEEAGSGIWPQPLPGGLGREGGFIARLKAHPLPRNLPVGKIPVLEQRLSPFQTFVWGRKDSALNWRLDLFHSRVKDCHDSTLFLYHVRCFTHLLECFFQKEGNPAQEGLYHNYYYYHSYCFEDFVLDCDLFPTIRPALIICSLNLQASSSTIREDLTKTSPMTRCG